MEKRVKIEYIMSMKRLYIETSVWNQLEHTDKPDWKKATEDFLQTVETGIYDIYVSELVIQEISKTRDSGLRKRLLDNALSYNPDMLHFNAEAKALVNKYREANIIKSDRPRVLADMGHVAIATVAGIRNIISYNFDHLLKDKNINAFNGVNLQNGYDVFVNIRTPESFIDLD